MALALMKASLEPERGAVQNDSNTPDLEDYSDLQDDSEGDVICWDNKMSCWQWSISLSAPYYL